MASIRKDICVILIVAIMALLATAKAQSNCNSVLISLASFLNYVTGKSSTPSSCCSKLASVVQSQPRCLCTLLNGGGSSLGITINQTLALQLPGACHVKIPPVSQCSGIGSPAESPVASPVGSPEASRSQSSNAVPGPQTGSLFEDGGSKTTLSTGGTTSTNGVPINVHLQLVSFLLPMAIYLTAAYNIFSTMEATVGRSRTRQSKEQRLERIALDFLLD